MITDHWAKFYSTHFTPDDSIEMSPPCQEVSQRFRKNLTPLSLSHCDWTRTMPQNANIESYMGLCIFCPPMQHRPPWQLHVTLSFHHLHLHVGIAIIVNFAISILKMILARFCWKIRRLFWKQNPQPCLNFPLFSPRYQQQETRYSSYHPTTRGGMVGI